MCGGGREGARGEREGCMYVWQSWQQCKMHGWDRDSADFGACRQTLPPTQAPAQQQHHPHMPATHLDRRPHITQAHVNAALAHARVGGLPYRLQQGVVPRVKGHCKSAVYDASVDLGAKVCGCVVTRGEGRQAYAQGW
jgi:hypothetical protein